MEAKKISESISAQQKYNADTLVVYPSQYLSQVVISTLIYRAQVVNNKFCCFGFPRSTLPTVDWDKDKNVHFIRLSDVSEVEELSDQSFSNLSNALFGFKSKYYNRYWYLDTDSVTVRWT